MYCLDTDAIVDFLRGDKKISSKIEQNAGKLFTTEISILELYYGVYASINPAESIKMLRGFLSNLGLLKFNEKAFELFGKTKAELKKEGRILDNFDLAIACLSLAHDKILITNNVKHFERISSLKIENWSRG